MIKTLLIVGYGRAGKDAAGQHLGRVSTLRYGGSTSWAGLSVVADRLGVHPMEAWENRHNCRQVWKDFFDSYRTGDESVLARMALATGDIITGVRDKVELEAVKKLKLVDHILWIARPGIPVDQTVTFTYKHCDEILLNEGSLQTLYSHLERWAEKMGILK